jgi:hypothetical protein
MNLSRTAHGDDLFRIYKGPWTTWPQPAQAIVDGAGRRGAIPPMVVPPLSPPYAPGHVFDCSAPPTPPPPPPGPPGPPPPPPPSSFAAGNCVKGRVSQQWSLSPSVVPGDGKPTNVVSASHGRAGGPSTICWEIAECYDGGGINCKNGCKALPKPGTGCPDACPTGGAVCDFNGAHQRRSDDLRIHTTVDRSNQPACGQGCSASTATGRSPRAWISAA